MFSVDKIINAQFPELDSKSPLLTSSLIRLLRSILREKDFNDFSAEYPQLQGIDFIDQVLTHFHFDFSVRMNERAHIPAQGAVIIVANHPIGSLDGLALLKMVHEIRPDVKAVANNMLQNIGALQSLLLPVNNLGGNTPKAGIRAIHRFLQEGSALIIFPAGAVSRLGATGVQDGEWHPGFLRMAQMAQAPIVPVFVDGRNSPLFYGMSLLCRPLSTLWLVREMFKQRNRAIAMRIGEPVPYSSYAALPLKPKAAAKLFRKHLYRIGKGKSPLLETEGAIALPENRQQLRTAVRSGTLLGTTRDNKTIWLYEYQPDSPVMREIARLRELSFRAVGEGCGKRRDTDRYDMHYQHMLLWDDEALEIVGAYRWRATGIPEGHIPSEQLYTAELFRFSADFQPVLANGLELGRSFVQPRYWGHRSLDYLWYGIGAYLKTRPDIRYLFGPVSISHNYPQRATAMLVYFYRHCFGVHHTSAMAKLPFVIPPQQHIELSRLFQGQTYQENFCILKAQLQEMGLAVPTMYKQYTELCEPGGAQFLDFNIDPAFSHCVDGLAVIDISRIKPARLNRYMGSR